MANKQAVDSFPEAARLRAITLIQRLRHNLVDMVNGPKDAEILWMNGDPDDVAELVGILIENGLKTTALRIRSRSQQITHKLVQLAAYSSDPHEQQVNDELLGRFSAEDIEFAQVTIRGGGRSLIECLNSLYSEVESSQEKHGQPNKMKPIKEPTQRAWKAWQLQNIVGLNGQEAIVKELIKQGINTTQSTVSRDLQSIDDWLKVGGPVPDVPEPAKPEFTMSPEILDMGKRTDAHAPHQRSRRIEE